MIHNPWTRSKDGLVAGVCQGLADRFDVEPWIFRVAFLVGAAIGGASLILYLILAFGLPREDRVQEAQRGRVLGVCAHIARKQNLDVGVVRVITLLVFCSTFSTALIAYLVLYVVLSREDSWNQTTNEKVVNR